MSHTKMASCKPVEFEAFGTEDGSHKHAITEMLNLLADHHIKRLAR